MLRLLLVLGLLPISVMLTPLYAGAQDLVTITIGADGALLDRTLVRVPVTITCEPMEVDYNQGYAELRQAVSKELIAHGTGWPESLIVCDGLPHVNPYRMWADTDSPPFEKGNATMVVSVYLCGSSTCQSGYSGVQLTRLGRER